MLHVKLALIGQAVSEKKIFENSGRRTTDGRRTDGRTTEHGYTISSPCEPDGSGELKSADQLCSNCTADQCLCFRIGKKYNSSSTYTQNFKILALFCDCTDRFVSDLLQNWKTAIFKASK